MADWDGARRRYRLAHDAAEDVARNGREALTRWDAAIAAEYGGREGFLRDVQRRYHTAAVTRLDAVLEAGHADGRAPVAAAIAEVDEALPDLRRLLAEYGDHPALAEGEAWFRRSVLEATGVDPGDLLPTASRPADRTAGFEGGRRCLVIRRVRTAFGG